MIIGVKIKIAKVLNFVLLNIEKLACSIIRKFCCVGYTSGFYPLT